MKKKKEKENQIKGNERNILVIYDISNDKRRRKIVKVLDSYGVRIQESAFECYISIYLVDTLISKVRKCVDSVEDRVRIYQMNDGNVIDTIGTYEGPPKELCAIL